ncbi:MAG: hypothetical protein K2Q22_15255 [Cytophagales bacterium]|nr:hypothetical protein [Cytophagales bacterium]
MSKNYIENLYGKFWLEDGIIYFIRNTNNDLDLNGAKLCTYHSQMVGGGKPCPTYVDISKIKIAPIDVRQYFASEEALAHVTAVAIFVNSALTAFIANTFLKFGNPVRPTRIFNEKETALKWLKQFK